MRLSIIIYLRDICISFSVNCFVSFVHFPIGFLSFSVIVFVALCVYMSVFMCVFSCAYAVCTLSASDLSFCDKVAFSPHVFWSPSDFFLVSFC